jgi:hypothetical protein
MFQTDDPTGIARYFMKKALASRALGTEPALSRRE